MNHDKYYWVHLQTGQRGSESWTSWDSKPTEREKLELLNKWNREAMISGGLPTYHYWM